jgi:NodT family efflux transporter outer membrane factor (OMF) lipoprotein
MTPRYFSLAARAGLLLLLLAGCAETTPTSERSQFLNPPALERTLAQSGTGKSAKVDAIWPESDWWRRFHSPELDRMIEKGLADNPNLKKAFERLREAEAIAKVEGAPLTPFLNMDLGMRQSRIPNHGVVASYNPNLAGLEKTMAYINPLGLTYQFDFWGKNQAALDAALGQAAAQQAQAQEARLLLTTSLSRVYFRIRALSRQVEVARKLTKLRREVLALAQTRYRTGIDTQDGVTQAAADVETSVKREAGVQALLAMQQDLAARLMGEGPDAGRGIIGAQRMTQPAPPPLPKHLPVEMLARRPDLAAAMNRAEAAAERIHVAKAAFLPSLDLTIAGGFEASRSSPLIDDLGKYLFRGSAIGYVVNPNIHLPIFHGGSLRGVLEERRSEYDEAVDSYNETLLEAAQQVADSLANLKQTRAQTEAQRRLVGAKRAELGLAVSRWRSGLRDKRELLAESHVLLEQVYYLEMLDADDLVANVDLIQALGGGYENDAVAARPRPAPEQDSLTPIVETIESLGGG